MDEIISYKMCAVKVRNAKLRNYLKYHMFVQHNTAEKRLRMRNLTCNSIANLMRSCSERVWRIKMAVKTSDFIVRLYSQISSAKINMSF
jgi:hypothetical protein